MRAAGNLVELVPMTFGFPASRPRGGPVFSFRSEGRRFDKSTRCLIPASAFYKFTGKRSPKAKHRFALKNDTFMAIAGLWRETEADRPPASRCSPPHPVPTWSLIMTAKLAVLRPEDWAAWLYLTRPEAELLRPLPAGSLKVQTVRGGSD